MKQYKILKSFLGSQDGTKSEQFKEGDIAGLSDYLVSCVDPKCIEGVQETKKEAVKPAKAAKTTNKASK